MKGLIYREIYLSKKGILLGFALGLAYFVAAALVLLSARYGNIAKYMDPADIESLLKNVSSLIPPMIFIMFIAGIVDGSGNLIFTDHMCGWHKHMKCSGLSIKAYIGAKYLSVLLMMFFCFALMLIVVPALLILGGKNEPGSVFRYILPFMSWGLLMEAYLLPVNLHCRKRENKRLSFIIICTVIILGAIAVGAYAVIDEEGFLNTIKVLAAFRWDVLIYLLPLISGLIMYLSYRLSVRIVEKEEL
ncbi:MAG: hypothetical protein K5686_06215 [Lachnospiraceae bacterium]|nr:hypothetical protein [Lachnospiraceae bacterium]